LELIVLESHSPHPQAQQQHEGVPRMALQNTVSQLKFASLAVIGFGFLTALFVVQMWRAHAPAHAR
jgi:hypothetical protein